MDVNIQHRECSYCKSILHDGHAHNIRTCTKALNQGKSPYLEYNEGIFKLLYIKGISQDILNNEFSTFTHQQNTSAISNQQHLNIPSVETLIVPKCDIALPNDSINNNNGAMKTTRTNNTTLHENEY